MHANITIKTLSCPLVLFYEYVHTSWWPLAGLTNLGFDPEECSSSRLQFNSAKDSDLVLEALKDRPGVQVKFVAVRLDNRIMLALGWERLKHIHILNHATELEWGRSVVTDSDPQTGRAQPGVHVDGGRLTIEWASKRITVIGGSDTFGMPSDQIFIGPTVDAVEKIILKKLESLTSQG